MAAGRTGSTASIRKPSPRTRRRAMPPRWRRPSRCSRAIPKSSNTRTRTATGMSRPRPAATGRRPTSRTGLKPRGMRAARLPIFSALLSFNGGFVDVACFFGLKGLLAAHITGNLATLCASIVLGTAGLISKILAVPEFMIVVALAHATARILNRYGWPSVRILLGFEAVLLTAFLALAVRYGPFADPDSG